MQPFLSFWDSRIGFTCGKAEKLLKFSFQFFQKEKEQLFQSKTSASKHLKFIFKKTLKASTILLQ